MVVVVVVFVTVWCGGVVVVVVRRLCGNTRRYANAQHAEQMAMESAAQVPRVAVRVRGRQAQLAYVRCFPAGQFGVRNVAPHREPVGGVSS